MELHVSFRVGVHIEHKNIRALVQAMLSTGGHQSLVKALPAPSVSAYLETILVDLQQGASSPYDLLIVSCDDDFWRRGSTALIMLFEQLSLWPLPLLILTDLVFKEIDEFVRQQANVGFLPRSPLSAQQFFQSLCRLTHTPSQMPVILHSHQRDHEKLVQQERARIVQRLKWLDQRQEWLDQKKAWLRQRQAWIEVRGMEPHPQQEWLAEQQAEIEQQWEEVKQQQQQLFDLRRWLLRYQSRLNEDYHPPFREAQ